jgi:hypothetical protein
MEFGDEGQGQIKFEDCDVPRVFPKLVPIVDSRDGHIIIALKYMSKANRCFALVEQMKKENPLYPKKTAKFDINQMQGDADFYTEEAQKHHEEACKRCGHEDCLARDNYMSLVACLGSASFRNIFLKDLKTKPNLACTNFNHANKQEEML